MANPKLTRFGPTPRPISDRLWSHVQICEPVACWPWVGTVDSCGYGRIRCGSLANNTRHYRQVHRVVWEIVHGPIPVGLCVLHHCDNPPCVNPQHLWLGTQQDNIADMVKKGRNFSFKRQRGVKNPNAKLTEQRVREIRTSNIGTYILARQYNVRSMTIWRVRMRKTWRHVT